MREAAHDSERLYCSTALIFRPSGGIFFHDDFAHRGRISTVADAAI
jgi:hypothetical protein